MEPNNPRNIHIAVIYTTQYSDIQKYNTKGKQICIFNYATQLVVKKV
jgi:hypothetical protein